MRNPLTQCGNCAAFEASQQQGQGHCHREPIKGHVVIGMPEIDLRTYAGAQNKQNYKVVPAFPPTLINLWCMAFVPTAETMQQMQLQERLKKDNLNN